MSEAIDNKELDVIVIGAGPAGGQCARELAKMGYKVALIERSQEIGEPNYSTAGTCLETIKDFSLPNNILSAEWNRIYLASTKSQASWTFDNARGYVFDFAGLRKFLAEDAARHGADILVGATVQTFKEDENNIVKVLYKGVLGDGELSAKVIVDATGHWCLANSLLKVNKVEVGDLASGLEVQMSAVPEGLEKTLAFYFGQVVPGGYAWSFPMEDSRAAKLGVITMVKSAATQKLNLLLTDFLDRFNKTNNLEPTEIHGGGGCISPGVKNRVYKNLVMIGDAAFQVNSLAYEGIRHAMTTGRLAAKAINQALSSPVDLNKKLKTVYENSWNKEFGLRWKMSYRIAKIIYQKYSDKDWDKLIDAMQVLSKEEAFAVFFNYQYEIMMKHPSLAKVIGWSVFKSLLK